MASDRTGRPRPLCPIVMMELKIMTKNYCKEDVRYNLLIIVCIQYCIGYCCWPRESQTESETHTHTRRPLELRLSLRLRAAPRVHAAAQTPQRLAHVGTYRQFTTTPVDTGHRHAPNRETSHENRRHSADRTARTQTGSWARRCGPHCRARTKHPPTGARCAALEDHTLWREATQRPWHAHTARHAQIRLYFSSLLSRAHTLEPLGTPTSCLFPATPGSRIASAAVTVACRSISRLQLSDRYSICHSCRHIPSRTRTSRLHA
jgi:hypothetical protein